VTILPLIFAATGSFLPTFLSVVVGLTLQETYLGLHCQLFYGPYGSDSVVVSGLIAWPSTLCKVPQKALTWMNYHTRHKFPRPENQYLTDQNIYYIYIYKLCYVKKKRNEVNIFSLYVRKKQENNANC
jgi:hypothetical protein